MIGSLFFMIRPLKIMKNIDRIIIFHDPVVKDHEK